MKYIFEITIKPNSTQEEYIEAWQKSSSLIQKSPGASGTKLYGKIGEVNKLIAIAEWESKELRDQAMVELEANSDTKEIIRKHRDYAEINLIGEYDEISLSE